MPFQLFSNAFTEAGWIPELHSCQGADLSPPLEWNGEPAETRSFTLIMEDPDAPAGTWCHWLLYDIAPQIHQLAQGFKAGSMALSGANDFGKPGYGGPCPPKGHGAHRYFFKLFAVDTASLALPAGARRADLQSALKGHILSEAQYLGRFERP